MLRLEEYHKGETFYHFQEFLDFVHKKLPQAEQSEKIVFKFAMPCLLFLVVVLREKSFQSSFQVELCSPILSATELFPANSLIKLISSFHAGLNFNRSMIRQDIHLLGQVTASQKIFLVR